MPNVSYPLDTTGLSAANKVTDEPHALTEVNSSTYRILIPDFAPFYQDNFKLVFIDPLGVSKTLFKDIDYTLTLPYLSASRSVGKMVYGGVAINNIGINGSLLMTYQTLGGDNVADIQFVREQLQEYVSNPRITSWDIIANKPEQFPPTVHTVDIDAIYGAQDLINAVEDVAAAVREGPNPSNQVVHHFTDIDNPHNTTKEQIELGLVQNYDTASAADIAAKASVDKYILLSQALKLIAPPVLTAREYYLSKSN